MTPARTLSRHCHHAGGNARHDRFRFLCSLFAMEWSTTSMLQMPVPHGKEIALMPDGCRHFMF